MNKYNMKPKKIVIMLIFLILISITFYLVINKNNEALYQTYENAVNYGKKEFNGDVTVLKESRIDDDIDNTNLIFYKVEESTTIYISKIVKYKNKFKYYRLSPTFNLTNQDINSSYEIPVTINNNQYYVLIGKVASTNKAYNNVGELKLLSDRIFVNINLNEENQVRFEEMVLKD